MNETQTNHQETTQEQLIRNATWTAILLSLAGFAFFGFAISEVSWTDWQDYVTVALTILLGVSGLASVPILRRGHIILGTGMVFAANLILPLVTVAFQRGLGWAVLVYTFTSSALIIWRALPRTSWRWAISTGITALIAMLFLTIFEPFAAFDAPPELIVFVILVTALLLIAFAILAIRQAWAGTIRTKLVASFILISLISLGTVAFFVTRSVQKALQNEVGANFVERSENNLQQINDFFLEKVGQLYVQVLDDILRDTIVERNTSYTGSEAQILEEILARDEVWIAAPDNNPLVLSIITANPAVNPAADELADLLTNFPDHTELILTDRYGANVATTGRTSDYFQGDEDWWQAAWNDGQGALYISEPEYDESTGVTALLIALPVTEEDTKEPIGVLRSTLNVESLFDVIAADITGETGHAVLFNSKGDVIVDPRAETVNSDGLPIGLRQEIIGQEAHFEISTDQHGNEIIFGHASLAPETGEHHEHAAIYSELGETIVDTAVELRWTAIFRQNTEEAFVAVAQIVQTIMIISVAVIALAVAGSAGLAQLLAGPIVRLTSVAEEIAGGNLTARANIETGDEVGTLAETFNQMTSQLQGTLENLEQRVADRTRALETSTEVSRRLSTILDQRELVREVVEQVQGAFNYYHAHIYLFDERKENLIMAGGTGEAGRAMLERGHSIPRGRGLVGRAGDTNLPVLVPDVAKAEGWLPNPLLPETKAEAAIPIAVSENVLGVLDVQDDEVGSLTETDVDLLQSIANQVALALQNARAYQRTQEQVTREVLIANINQRIQSTSDVKEALQVAVRELGRALGKPTIVNLNKIKSGNGQQNRS